MTTTQTIIKQLREWQEFSPHTILGNAADLLEAAEKRIEELESIADERFSRIVQFELEAKP